MYALFIHGLWKAYSTHKFTGTTFHGVKPAVTAAELHHAASPNHEIISVDLDMNVFGPNSGEVGFKDERVQALIEIYRRAPGTQLTVAVPRTVDHFIE
jgi:hypothetical protein